MKPSYVRPWALIRWLSVTTVLATVGTIAAEGQVPKRTPAKQGQAAPVPVYPSATFDAQTSAGMSSSGGPDSFFVYLTNDPAAKVVAFYTTKLGKTAQKVEEGSFAFFLRGENSAMPDLTVQSNLSGPLAGKTVITIAKHWR